MRIAIGLALIGMLLMGCPRDVPAGEREQRQQRQPQPSFLQLLGRALKADSEYQLRWQQANPLRTPTSCTTSCYYNTCYTNCY